MWEKEDMYVYIPANSDVQYSVNYVTEARVSASFYETKQLKKRVYGNFYIDLMLNVISDDLQG